MYSTGRGVAQDYAEAMKWYRKAADQGEAHAQTNLGYMYAQGHGVSKDDAEAVLWYRKAAEQGHARAQTNLAYMYLQGHGVPKDEAEAASLYRKAAEQGLPQAQNGLGVMYRDGLGVRKNLEIAYSLFLIVHMTGMGSETTQIRTNDNLRRLVAELSPAKVTRTLCSTDEYVDTYVHLRGKVAADFQGSPSAVRLRDKDWWLPSEQPNLPICK